MKARILLLCLLTFALSGVGQGFLRGSGGINNDEALDIAKDGMGNTYTVGYFAHNADFGAGAIVTSAGLSDGFLNKRNPQGETVWVKSFGGPQPDRAVSVAVDPTGNSVVTGFFKGTATFGSVTLTSLGGSQDVFVAKFDTNGNVLWAISFGGSGDDIGYSIDVNANGMIAVGGQYSGAGSIGSVSLTSMGGSPDAFVALLNPSGVVQWAKLGQAPMEDRTLGVAIDPGGNLYATGQFSGNITWDNTHPNVAQNAAFLVKFNPSGAEAGFVRFAGPQVLSSDMKFTPDGNLVVTGNFVGGLTFFYTNPQQFLGTFNDNIFLFKTTPELNMVWFRSESSENELICKAVDFDQQNNLYITGTFKCTFTDLNAESGESLWKSLGYRDVFLLRYSSSGTRDLKLHFGGRKDDMCQAVTARNGIPLLAGGFEETICIRNHSSFQNTSGSTVIGGSLSSGCTNTSQLRYITSSGNRDIFITQPHHPNVAPFDFYNHEPPNCSWDHKPLCLKAPEVPCCANATVCQGTVLQVCSYYQFSSAQTPGLPVFSQSISPSQIANSTGTYTVTLTRADGCYVETGSIFVTIEPTPQPPTFSSSDGTYTNEPGSYDELYICGDEVVLTTGTNNPPGSFMWQGPLGQGTSTSITADVSGIYQLNYTSPFGCNSAHFVEVVFEYQPVEMDLAILPLNGLVVGDTIYLCPGQPLHLGMVNLFDGFVGFDIQLDDWVFTPPTPFSSTAGATIWLSPAPGRLTVNGTLEFLYCPELYAASQSWYIQYFDVPDLSISISGPTLLCPGESAVLTFSGILGPISYWDFPGTVNDVYEPTLTISGPGTYLAVTEILDDNECLTTAGASHTVQFKTPPTIAMEPSNGVLCPGETVTLTAQGAGMTFQWFNPSGTMFSTSQTSIAGSAGSYYVIGTDSEGCSLESQFSEVYLYASPFLMQFPEESILCNGQPIAVSVFATIGSTIEWGPPLNTNAPQVLISEPGTYSVSATLCNVTEVMTITVVNAIEPPEAFVESDDILCPGGVITLYGQSGYDNYLWMPSGQTSQNAQVSSPGEYTLTVTDENGCQAASQIIAIDLYVVEGTPLPNDSVCFGQIVELAPSTSGVVHWYSDAELNQTLGSGPLTVGPLGLQTILFYTFDDGVCESGALSVVLSVRPLTPIDSLEDILICFGESGTIEPPNSDLTFWLDEGFEPSGTGDLDVGPVTENLVFYYYQLDGNQCPTDTGMVNVIVPFALTPQIWGDSLYCQGETLVVSTDLQANIYWWTTPTGFFSTTVPQYSIANAGPGHSGVYSVSLQTGPCSAQSGTHELEVIAVSQHVFGASDFTCEGSQLTVVAPQGFDYYLWNGEPGNYFNTFINPLGIELIIGNEPGCERRYEFGPEVPYCPDFLPNIISPNGDGINEGIDFLAIFGVFEKVLIFNRWGTKVRELNMDAYFWDGTMDNGRPCSEGTYYYIVYRANEVPGKKGMSGYVMVVR